MVHYGVTDDDGLEYVLRHGSPLHEAPDECVHAVDEESPEPQQVLLRRLSVGRARYQVLAVDDLRVLDRTRRRCVSPLTRSMRRAVILDVPMSTASPSVGPA